MSVVDAHHHVWRIARGDYGWLTPALAPIHRDFDVDDHRRAAPFVDEVVLVQAAPTVAETRFLLDAARASEGRVGAVVGWADLDADGAPREIEALAREPLLRSLRPMLQDLPDPAWILRPRVDEALRALAPLGLAFDALVTPRELPALIAMAARHTELAIVVDHGAKPAIAGGGWEPWAAQMAELARMPHVHCKLSGLVTEAGTAWSVSTLAPYVEHLAARFGASRLIWGSDWPVVELGGGMARWWEATQALLAPLDAASRAAILGGNARRFYRLAAGPDAV